MFGNGTLILSANLSRKFDYSVSIKGPNISSLKHKHIQMWRKVAKQVVSSRKLVTSFVEGKPLELGKREIDGFLEMGYRHNHKLLSQDVAGSYRIVGSCGFIGYPRSYASVAEAIVSSTDTEEEEEVREELGGLVKETGKEVEKVSEFRKMQGQRRLGGLTQSKKYKEQVRIETEAWEQAAAEYKELLFDMCEQKLAPNLPYIKSLFLGWFEPLRNAIAEEQKLYEEGKNRNAYAPQINQLPADMMALITMHKLMALLMTGGEHGSARVVQAACQIGEAIEEEVKIHRFLEKTSRKKNKKKAGRTESEGSESDDGGEEQLKKVRKKVSLLMKKQKTHQVRRMVKGQDDSKPWGQDAQAKLGSRLIEMLMETAYIQPPVDQLADGPPDIRPAFRHSLKTVLKEDQKSSRRYGVIECDPLIRQGLDKTARHMVIPYMPMLVPPRNWTGYDRGGYLFLPSYIMRIHGSKQQREAVKRTSRTQLEPVFEALNTLGNTKWRTNWRVLNVIDRLWASGGRLAGLVDRDDIPLPEQPDTDDEVELKIWKHKFRVAKKENCERHAQRCDIELKLAVARKMKDQSGFYYPHNLDFRGRAYPMHPYLNHLGSDICRGILEFAEGRPLGKSGLEWLKIHIANLYAVGGVDKLSYDGRRSFTENHLNDIFDSADRPLEGERWWLGAEDPFQCLAACINLAEALRSSSPETYISHMPVHQDGSCNGLQHYAALGRDKLGAAAVNLVAGDKPADVYKGIANRVWEIMEEDKKKPSEDLDGVRARLLVDHVDRKLVKQTVMTSVYGVTFIGARDQIKKRLKERGVIDDDELFGASTYAAKVTLAALGEMFQAARSIMDWLGDCAKVIASANHPVRWTTPLGLPVVQPYRKFGRHLIRTSLQVLTLQRETDTVLGQKQRTAFPPNFVHSLDGSHMMMTAIACKKAGLNFAGVHDSYWTHACDVDVMNRILREKFVELYEQPILENLLESFQQSFPELTFPPLPKRGDFDLSEVVKSPYFFN